MRQIPMPTYEHDVQNLVLLYERAIREIRIELERMDLTDFQRANIRATLSYINEIITELNKESAAWVQKNMPKAARDGIAATLVDLGVAATLADADRIVRFNRPNKEAIAAAVADTQSDLLQVTQNVERKVRAAVRQVTSEVMRENMTKGISGAKTIRREILAELRKRLGDTVNTGIIDAAGRRWKPRHYVDTLTRTKLMETYHTAKRNESVVRGAYYGLISRHGAKDACRFHEGRIMKLTPNAPGNYPTYDELKGSGQIWHPRCQHTYTTITNPEDDLPEFIKKEAEKQAERGERAVATGKRNPDVD